MQDTHNGEYYIVEPNIDDHYVFKISNYRVVVAKADIIVFLIAHNEFKALDITSDKVVLDFCGVYR